MEGPILGPPAFSSLIFLIYNIKKEEVSWSPIKSTDYMDVLYQNNTNLLVKNRVSEDIYHIDCKSYGSNFVSLLILILNKAKNIIVKAISWEILFLLIAIFVKEL